MSSAAKLRTAGRSTAVLATAAIVMTSFGPTAFAWDTPGTDVKTAKTGSVGLVDTDRATAGTQGATAIVAGGQSQAVADIRLVVPVTYAPGDYIDLDLASSSDANKRVLWASLPNVEVAGPYAASTHVGVDGQTSKVDGETEEVDKLAAYEPNTADGETVPAKPAIQPSLVTGADGDTKLRLTFNTQADSSQFNAKFVLTLKGLKVNVGSGVPAGEVPVTVTGKNVGGGNPTTNPLIPATGNVTIPAAVTQVGLQASTTSLVADDTVQTLGNFSVEANGATFNTADAVTVTAGGYPPAVSPDARATFYNAANQVVGTPQLVTISGNNISATAPAAGATRVEFSGVLIDTTANAGQLTLTLGSTPGGIDAPDATLTASSVNQTDIAGPNSTVATVAVNPVVTRLGGADRYETSAKMAEEFAGNLNLRGEVDNLVIASGESFPDALSSGYLAATKNAPVILAQKGRIPTIVGEFIRNHGVKNVYIVGGEGAVSKEVEAALRATEAFDLDDTSGQLSSMNAKLQVVRISGANRFETNKAVNEYAAARTTQPVGTTVPKYGSAARKTAIVVNGMTPWDALAAGPMVAGVQGVPAAGSGALPIVLTNGATLNTSAKAQMQTLDIGHAIFVGGYGILPQSLEGEIAGLGTTSTRLGGTNRYQTAEAVGNFLLKPATINATTTPGFGFAATADVSPYLTNGGQPNANAWADALSAGPLAAQNRTILALTAATSLPADTKDLLTANKTLLTPVTALGLGGAVSTEVVGAANQAVAGD